jgi:FkbM family methyltransferase
VLRLNNGNVEITFGTPSLCQQAKNMSWIYRPSLASNGRRVMWGKFVRRAIRYNPVVERLQRDVRSANSVSFVELGLIVPVASNSVIIDAGANVGVVTSKCARTGATVHAFEPNRSCYDILKRRFRYVPNVHIHHAGLMDRNCTLTLSTPIPHRNYDALETTVAASFVAERYDAPVVTEQVPCVDVADFVRSIGGKVSLFKMDIEGAEIAVIHRLLDEGLVGGITIAVVETHERFSPKIAEDTRLLKERVIADGFGDRFRFDWI